ncbi:hypothetical protein ANCDUO_14896 [Ancylostoma duodenale]|uniref:SCP domain-containing protein n=1 Tax=Ancylostoma duodenale TaxID=51022 RepID=A0A0C2G7U0_9BILA|nr:hypothetical protein ANCDUO_14896 [Ancylostoma duodenale]
MLKGIHSSGAAQQNLYTSSNNQPDICNACAGTAPCENGLCNERPAAVALEVKQCTGNAKKDLMTDDLRDQALNIHNYYRRLLATGWAKDAKLGYAHPATAMPKLVLADWWAPLENTGNPDNTYTDANAAALKTYINMAHKDTVKVGCGVQTCAKIGKTLVQCAYNGAPTVPDDAAIYTPGKACSKCKDIKATPNCSPLGGLCIA